MKTILKTLLKSVLCYLILSYTLTSYPPPLFNDPGYGVCKGGCNTKEHHTNSHQLTKWTDKEIKLYYQLKIDLSFRKSQNSILLWKNKLTNRFTLFSLNGRPPPFTT